MQARAANAEIGRTKTLRMVLGSIGLFFILAGLYGFLDPSFFGLFDLTDGHNWIHLLTGVLYAYVGFAPTPLNVVTWTARIGGIVYLLLGVLGFMMAEGTLSPLMALGTNENVFHLIVGAGITAVGFALPTRDTEVHGRTTTT